MRSQRHFHLWSEFGQGSIVHAQLTDGSPLIWFDSQVTCSHKAFGQIHKLDCDSSIQAIESFNGYGEFGTDVWSK
jgi:hypothetical protein